MKSHCKAWLQEDTRNSFLRPPTNVVLERELRRDTSLRKGEANGSVLGSIDETQVFSSHDQTSDGRNGLSSTGNGDSQAAVRGNSHPSVPFVYIEKLSVSLHIDGREIAVRANHPFTHVENCTTERER